MIKTIEIQENKIEYLVQGKGKRKILALPGIFSTKEIFQPLISYLEKDFTFITLDLPGFGKSTPLKGDCNFKKYTQIIAEFCRRLNLNNIFLIGVSYGGSLAINLCFLYPKRFSGLILVSPFIKKDYIPFYYRWGVKVLTKSKLLWSLLMKYNQSSWIERIYPLTHPGIRKIAGKEIRWWHQTFSRYHPPSALSLLKEILTLNLEEKLFNLNLPLLIISGKRDNKINFKHLNDLNKFLKRGEVKGVSKADHALIVEKPKIIAQELKKFTKNYF